MAKPPVQPVWATDANFAAGPESFAGTQTKTQPLSGKKAMGFQPKERPSARYLNWLFNTIYLWIAYLAAGIFEGDSEFTGNLLVDGNLTVGGTVQATTYKHTANIVQMIPPGAALDGGGGGNVATGAYWTYNATTAPLIYPIIAKTGDRITAWRLYVDPTSGSPTVRAQLYKGTYDSGTNTIIKTPIGGFDTKTSSGLNIQILAKSALAVDCGVSGNHESFWIEFENNAGTPCKVFHAEVSIQRP